jgi:NADPH:quinone reductase-like Zn-dependent oxidoreductase
VKAVVVERYRSVVVREVEKPEPGAREVRVRVLASSLNAIDWYGFSGCPYVARPMLGLIRPKSTSLGSDFAGVVDAIGDEVDDFAVGSEVYGCGHGTLAEYVVAGEAVERKPANLSFDEAAAVPLAGLTALQGLRDHGGVRRGTRVLINGASGGVGIFAVQIAKALGAEAHAVCSTRNVDQARALGADRTFDYTSEDFTRGGDRYDVLFDNAGNRSWASMHRVLAPGGTIVLVGGPRRKRALGPLGHIARIKLAAKLRGERAVFFIAKPNRSDLATLRDLVEAGEVRPVVERRYELEGVGEAVRAMGEGHARAKLVVEFSTAPRPPVGV